MKNIININTFESSPMQNAGWNVFGYDKSCFNRVS